MLLKPFLQRLWLPLTAVLLGSALAVSPEPSVAQNPTPSFKYKHYRDPGCHHMPHYGVNNYSRHCCLLAY